MEEELKESDKNRDLNELPIKITDSLTLQRLFPGKFIAIYEEQIIAEDISLKNLHEKIKTIIPENEGCIIDFIEESVGIYGFEI